MSAEYEVQIDGLAEAIARCSPAPGHRALVDAVRRLPGIENAKLATTRGEEGGHYYSRHAVIAADGTRVHDDHEAWLREQVQADGGNVCSTRERLRSQGLRLAKTHLATLYVVVDRGGGPADFIQIEVLREEERLDCELFNDWDRTPKDIERLIGSAEGNALPDEQRVPLRPARYRFAKAVDIQRFVQLAQALHERKNGQLRRRTYVATNDTGAREELKHGDLDPDFESFPDKAKRFFDDWAASSSGRSGARLCEHWVMQLTDWTDPRSGERTVSLIPAWTLAKKLAEVDASKGDDYSFYGRLQTLDRRVKVPFAWYFFMLHGNRVHDGAGHRALRAAEQGLIVMPEHDYRVLRAWQRRPYGF